MPAHSIRKERAISGCWSAPRTLAHMPSVLVHPGPPASRTVMIPTMASYRQVTKVASVLYHATPVTRSSPATPLHFQGVLQIHVQALGADLTSQRADAR
jgi:hypothetical protein